MRVCGLILVVFSMLLTACDNPFNKKTNWSVTLDKDDKRPYGSYLAFESLKYIFPHSKISELSSGFRYSSIDEEMASNTEGPSLFIAVGLDFHLTRQELRQLLSFAQQGNEVIVFSRALDEKLEKFLKCSIRNNGAEEVALTKQNSGSENLKALTIKNDAHTYGYQGRSISASFAIQPVDTTVADSADLAYAEAMQTTIFYLSDTLGHIKEEPNIIRYAIGKGHLTLHAGPLTMSNYFLLQPGNRRYLQALWQTFPANIARIYWNNYFKRSTKAADLGVLLKYPATRWAFILAALALVMYILFEGKRKQRVIPVIPPLENTSVSFVETVGRLYHSRSDHSNLGEKMIQHFLEWVRSHYFINTNKLDDHFRQQLIVKSGLPESVIVSLMEMIREIHVERKPIDDKELYHLHNTIQQFYKSNRS